jgi:hypothetical protein
MMVFPLKLAYDRVPADANEMQTTVAMIRHAVSQKYPDGLPRTELRLWARIDAAMDAEAPPESLELTAAQFTFIRDCAQAAKWPVQWTRYAVTFLDALEAAERTL